jgi:hypothetical protein
MARMYDHNAKFDPAEFDPLIQAVLISGAYDVCQRRTWRLHGAGTDPTHAHFAISWRGFTRWGDVRDKLKNLLSLFIGRATGITGRPWFVAEGSRKRVADLDHLEYLLGTYFPSHRGLSWREGTPLPEIPAGIL